MTDEESSLPDKSEIANSGLQESQDQDVVAVDSATSVSDIDDAGDGSFNAYLKGSLTKLRSGQSGLLPILVGLTALVIFF